MPSHWADSGDLSHADLAACRALLRQGSRTFHAASLTLPQRVREAATALYAFCRVADDTVDVGGDRGALAALRLRLAHIYAGRPDPVPADRAFAAVVHRYSIPRDLPNALLEGFEWDLHGRRYSTLSELNAYAVRVAGTVGTMMAMLMGVRSTAALARACDLGVAMQLTNIARDVGDDARAGRIYLPMDWLQEAGIDPQSLLARPEPSAALGTVVQRLLSAADLLYARAAGGIASLPAACRPGMHAARLLYAEIGREVERGGLDSVNRRAIVPWPRKAWLLSGAILAATRGRVEHAAPPLDEARFLVEAAAESPDGTGPVQSPASGFDARVAWLVELFDRLERRERAAASRLRSQTGSWPLAATEAQP